MVPARYSHSSLSTFEQCPLKFDLKYVRRVQLDEKEEGIEGFMGSRVHETLEKLYEDLQQSKLNGLGELLSHYEQQWDRHWHDAVVVVKKHLGPENYRETGRKCITRYYARYHPFDQAETVGIETEVPIRFSHDGQDYELIGFIDRLDQLPNGTYEIHDYKTAAKLPRQEELDQDRQLALYQLGLREMYPDVDRVELVWHYLAHDKEVRSTRDDRDLDRLQADVAALIDHVEEARLAEAFPARPSTLCNWCEYRPVCPEWAHVYRTEALPPNEFLAEEGVTLVNEYARRKEELKALTAEAEVQLAKIEEALVAYAERENVTSIAGSDHKVNVRRNESIRLPLKGTGRRQALEGILRKAGLYDDLVDLDVNALKNALRHGQLPPAVAAVIEPFVERETKKRVTLAARRHDED